MDALPLRLACFAGRPYRWPLAIAITIVTDEAVWREAVMGDPEGFMDDNIPDSPACI
jgi:hypothetical protein